MVFVFSED